MVLVRGKSKVAFHYDTNKPIYLPPEVDVKVICVENHYDQINCLSTWTLLYLCPSIPFIKWLNFSLRRETKTGKHLVKGLCGSPASLPCRINFTVMWFRESLHGNKAINQSGAPHQLSIIECSGYSFTELEL